MLDLDFQRFEPHDLPKELRNLKPADVVVFLDNYDIDSPTDIYAYKTLTPQLQKLWGGFPWVNRIRLNVRIELTDNPRLRNRLFARTFDIGSLTKYTILSAKITSDESIREFLTELSDIKGLYNRGDYFLDVIDISNPRFSDTPISESKILEERELPIKQEDYESEDNPPKQKKESFRRRLFVQLNRRRKSPVIKDENVDSKPQRDYAQEIIAANRDDELDVKERERLKREMVNSISAIIVDYVNRTREMPPLDEIEKIIKGKLVLTDSGLSRMVLNENLQIVLPDYNEMIVKMRPLPLTVYILFMRHPEGIELRDIPDYREELEEIYSLVMPNRDEQLVKQSINSLIDSTTGSLHQKITNIKRVFNASIFNDETAAQYYIRGQRGGLYKIHLPAEMMQLPAIFRN